MTQEGHGLPQLPRNWIWTRIGEIGEVVTGRTPRKDNPYYYGDEYPFFKPADLNAGYHVKSSIDGLSEEGLQNARLLPEKSVLVTCIGATIGKTGFTRVPGATNQQINALVPHETLLPEFIFFMCISPQFQKSITDNSSSTTLPIINKRKFQGLPFPLPPYLEQRRIVTKIENLFGCLDAGFEGLKRAKAQLKRYRQAVLKSAFEGKLTEEWRKTHKDQIEPASALLERIREERIGRMKEKHRKLSLVDTSELPEIPESWVWTRLGEIGRVAAGGTPSTSVPEYFDGAVPWITPADLSAFTGKFINRGKRNISEKGLNSSSAILLPAGTVVFSSRAPIGYVAIAANPVSTNQGFKNLVLYEGVFNEYVFYYLKASKKLAESYGSGTTFREVSASRFAQIPVPLSPLSEQRRIVEGVEYRFSLADEAEKVISQSLERSNRLRKSILKRAFEGKLVPQDPSEEPAEKLMERIREERLRSRNLEKRVQIDEKKSHTRQMKLMHFAK